MVYTLLFDPFTLFPFRRAKRAGGKLFSLSATPPSGRPCRKWRGWPKRVLRGGSWNNDNPENLRSSYRNNDNPDNRNPNNGFRCVLGLGGSAPR